MSISQGGCISAFELFGFRGGFFLASDGALVAKFGRHQSRHSYRHGRSRRRDALNQTSVLCEDLRN